MLAEGEQDPGVGKPWAPTAVLHNICLLICTSNPSNPRALNSIAGAVQQCSAVCCHVNSVIIMSYYKIADYVQSMIETVFG